MLMGAQVTLDDLVGLRRLPGAGQQRGLAQQIGAHESRLTGAGMQISDVRHYQAGDDIRHIHWRISARSGGTFTKVYDVEHELPWLMVVLLTPTMYFGSRRAFKSVRALDAITQLCWQRQALHDPIGSALLSPLGSAWFAPARCQSGLIEQLDAWAAHSQQATQSPVPEMTTSMFDDFCAQLQGFAQRRQAVVVVGDFLPPFPWHQLIDRLHHHPTTFIQITDPLDTQLPDEGYYPVLHSNRLRWLMGSQAVRQRYQTDRLRWFSALRTALNPQRHRWVTLDTTQDPAEWHWINQEVLPDGR